MLWFCRTLLHFSLLILGDHNHSPIFSFFPALFAHCFTAALCFSCGDTYQLIYITIIVICQHLLDQQDLILSPSLSRSSSSNIKMLFLVLRMVIHLQLPYVSSQVLLRPSGILPSISGQSRFDTFSHSQQHLEARSSLCCFLD